jgi:putative ATPase
MLFQAEIPLSERLRPQLIDEFIGQSHLIGKGGPIRNIIESGAMPSIILWGPPGVGKTTLAQLIAKSLDKPFYSISAVEAGVKEVRKVIESARMHGQVVLFIDEIHRFSKSQQDALLKAVEKGSIKLIGATTENPSFEVISALLSRCQTYTLEAFGKTELEELLKRALKDEKLSDKKVKVKEKDALFRLSGGDGRKLLNLMEMLIEQGGDNVLIDDAGVQKVAQQRVAQYDKNGEQHYDIISAFIKSIRGSDPNAAVYWLARMIEGGEDPKFIARRLLILSSEDIGNANPTALVIANNCFQAVNVIGYPECRIILSQCVTYLACSAKSNAAYKAINDAQAQVKKTGDLQVPLSIRNAPTKLMKELGYGDNYKYAHSFEGNFANQEFMPEELKGKKIYDPQNNQREQKMREDLRKKWGDKYKY